MSFNGPNRIAVTGVTLIVDRGFPGCVIQEGVKDNAVPTTHGMVKAAVLKGDDQCKDLIVMSVYDNKPVHFSSIPTESVKWITKTRSVSNITSLSLSYTWATQFLLQCPSRRFPPNYQQWSLL